MNIRIPTALISGLFLYFINVMANQFENCDYINKMNLDRVTTIILSANNCYLYSSVCYREAEPTGCVWVDG